MVKVSAVAVYDDDNRIYHCSVSYYRDGHFHFVNLIDSRTEKTLEIFCDKPFMIQHVVNLARQNGFMIPYTIEFNAMWYDIQWINKEHPDTAYRLSRPIFHR